MPNPKAAWPFPPTREELVARIAELEKELAMRSETRPTSDLIERMTAFADRLARNGFSPGLAGDEPLLREAIRALTPVNEIEPRFVAPYPLPLELGEVLAEYDLITARADPRDQEWDFVMRAADYRVLREFFKSLRKEGVPPIIITDPPRPA